MEFTITRALAQVKNLDKRIEKKISNLTAITYVKNSSDVVYDGKFTREEFAKNQRAELKSIQSLIALRKQLKSKIVISNANTKIVVGDITYTVAEAIERKNSIQHEIDLLERLKTRLKLAQAFIRTKNDAVEENALGIIQSLAGKDKAIKLDDNKLAQDYVKENSYGLIDPIDINKLIENMDKDIDAFTTNVDFALSESNAITKIDINSGYCSVLDE